MKQTILAIFAHPDDESFGPGGTLTLLAKNHNVVLVSVTSGEACTLVNGFNRKNILNVREEEMIRATKILGIYKTHFLHFPDGCLTNAHLPEIKKNMQSLINNVKPSSLITFEPHGFSGHLDHIAVTSVTTDLFRGNPDIKSIHYFGINQTQRKLIKSYFVYFPQGHSDDVINTTIDVSDVWDKKMQAIRMYDSQEEDRNFWQPMLSGYHKHEHFLSEYKDQAKHPFVELLDKKYLLKTTPSYVRW